MSDFLRPEARAVLWRWREVMAAGLVAALGLWWAMTAFGALQWLGLGLAVLGGAATLAATQRVRFARGGGGMGVVRIDEARVEFFGPFGGGMADMGGLQRLDLDRDARPAHWRLVTGDGQELTIPVDAEGADDLFEAFTRLPGLTPTRLTRAMARTGGREMLWRREGAGVTRLPRPH